MGVVVQRRQHTALHHILHHGHSLERDRFAAGIGPRHHQYAALGSEGDVERHHLLAVGGEALAQHGVHGVVPLHGRPAVEMGQRGIGIGRQRRLGAYEVEASQQSIRVKQVVDIGAQRRGKGGEDTYLLAVLLHLQLSHTVAGLDHLGRLDKDCLARGALVVDDTRDTALVHRRQRQHQPPVAHRRSGVGVDEAVAAGALHHPAHGGVDGAGHRGQPAAYVAQLGRGIVFELAPAVDDAVYLAHQRRESVQLQAQGVEMRIYRHTLVGAVGGKKRCDGTERGQRPAQLMQLGAGKPCAFGAHGAQPAGEVVGIGGGEVFVGAQDGQHLGRAAQQRGHGIVVGAESHAGRQLAAHGRRAALGHHAAHTVEACLFLEIVGVNHSQ